MITLFRNKASRIRSTYARHSKERREQKLFSIIAVLGILLLIKMRNVKSIGKNEDNSQSISTNIEDPNNPSIFKELPVHSIIKNTENPNKKNYEIDGKSFMLIKDIPFNDIYSPNITRPSYTVVIEQSSLESPKKCFLTFSYSKSKSISLLSKAISFKSASKKPKKVLIVPYNMMSNMYYLDKLKYSWKNYFKNPELFESIKKSIALLRGIYIQNLCKQYIKCVAPNIAGKNKIYQSFRVLKNNNLTTRDALKVVGLENTFFYDFVGRIEDLRFDIDIYNLNLFIYTIRDEKYKNKFEIKRSSKENTCKKTLELEKLCKTNDIIHQIILLEETKYSCCITLEHLVEIIANNTAFFINKLHSRKDPINNSKLEEEIKNIAYGFKIEKEIIAEVLRNIDINLEDSILDTEIDRAIEEEIEKISKEESKELNRAFIKENINLFLRKDINIIEDVEFEWKKRLIKLVNNRLKYEFSDKSLDEIKTDFAKMNKEIISEIEKEKKEIYARIKEISLLQNTYIERIVNLIEKICKNCSDAENYIKLESINAINDEIEGEIINLLSTIQVDYSKLMENSTQEEEIAKQEKSIRDILKNIEDIFDSEESAENSRDIKIKEEKRKIFSVELIEKLQSFNNRGIVDTHGIREVLESFINILVKRRIKFFYRPDTIRKASKIIERAKSDINEKNVKHLRHVLKFLKRSSVKIDDLYKNCEAWASNAYQTKLRSLLNPEPILDKEVNQILPFLYKEHSQDIYKLLYSLLEITDIFTQIGVYDEMWVNPIFLYLQTAYNSAFKRVEKKSYIVYRSKEYNELCKKEIEFSDQNLKAFIDATTIEDIEIIE